MTKPDIFSTHPHSLARMMNVEAGGEGLWTPEELGAILEHLLSAPIEIDLGRIDPALSDRTTMPQVAEGPPIATFRDLLEHPNPPVDLLDLTKRFAKRCREERDGLLPEEVAGVLYLWSIMAARVRCGRRISSMDDASLQRNIDWAMRHPWLDPSARALFRAGREAIGS